MLVDTGRVIEQLRRMDVEVQRFVQGVLLDKTDTPS